MPAVEPISDAVIFAEMAKLNALHLLRPLPDDSLRAALRACIKAEESIGAEQAKVRVLIDAATDEIERQAREYQYELVAKQLTYFADVARWRLKHLGRLHRPKAWVNENARCESCEPFDWKDPWGATRTTTGLLYWFAHWAWTYDPRNAVLKTLPFYLFPIQERALLAVEDAVFQRRSSLLIDKSRDMGVTWMLADWDIYHWRYTPGFAVLAGNRTEDEVDDSTGDMGATFNKLRFQIKLLPPELLPPTYLERRHSTYMNLTNPDNGANIAGAAPVEDFGRGDRRTVTHPDEFASWQQSKGYNQWRSMSQTTNSIIATSTVKGIFNKYGELLLDPNMPKLVMDWRDHPWKDERWYAQLKRGVLSPPMSATDIAQEVDRDPYASQPGQVLTQYSPVHNVITLSEFKRVYGRLHGANGAFRLPPMGWNVSVGQDVGCLTLGTQILTKDGWKSHEQLEVGESVAVFDWQDGQTVKWSPLRAKVYKDDQSLVRMKRKSFDFVCTDDHAWIIRRRKRGRMTQDTFRRQPLNTIPSSDQNDSWSFVIAARCDDAGESTCLPAVAAVLGWIVTDGWVSEGAAYIGQKNFPDRVITDLTESSLTWKELQPHEDGTRIFSVGGTEGFKRLTSLTGFRTKGDLPAIATRLSPAARQRMMEAMLEAEGTNNGTSRKAIFCQNQGPVSDAFQILATLSGIRLGKERKQDVNLSPNNIVATRCREQGREYLSRAYRIPLLRHTRLNRPKIIPIPGTHSVWCPTVDEGAVIARLNGQIAITGNTTPEHPNVTSYFTRPRELDPYPHFVFGIKEIVRVGLSTKQIADGIRDEAGRLLTPGFAQYEREQLIGCRITQRILSHEATNEQLCYQRDCDYKTSWAKWPGDAVGGIEQIDNAMTLDPTMPNPFVIDPRTTDRLSTWMPFVPAHHCRLCNADHEGEHLQGCSSFFLVAADDEAELLVDGGGKLYRQPARTEAGFHRARYEAPGWHYPESEKGKPVRARKPEKGEDDFWDSARMQLAYFMLTSARATVEQRIEAALPAVYQRESIAALPPIDRSLAEQGRYQQYWMVKADVMEQERLNSGLSIYET